MLRLGANDSTMKPLTRRIIGAAAVLVLIGVGILALRTLPVLPSIAASQIAVDLTAGELNSQAWENPDAGDELARIVADLGEASRTVTVDSVDSAGDTATATLNWTWEFASADQPWTYAVEVPLRRSGAMWKAEFDPCLVHPDLRTDRVLTAERTPGKRGRILGANDAVLLSDGEVIDVGLQPSKLTDEKATLAQLEKSLDVDAGELATKVDKADPEAFVPVITLRKDDYDLVKGSIYKLPGTVFRSRTQPLARTKGFAQATLGSAGRAEPDEVVAEPASLTPASYVGRSGIQMLYDGTLRPAPGLRILAVSAETGEGTGDSGSGDSGSDGAPTTLHTVDGRPGKDVSTTIDVAVQTAAEEAAKTAKKPTAIVAIRPSDGNVLAVANADPKGAAWDRALTGQYPPGSVFKVVSGAAMVESGIAPTTSLDCPKTTRVSGKRFKNAEDHVLGTVDFAESFAQSCNTAFVNSAEKVTATTLSETAMSMGMGQIDIGTDAYMASVPEVDDPVEHAAAMIGQGKVLATPLAVATMTATVAKGTTVKPLLVLPDARDRSGEVAAPDKKALTEVKAMMRRTVTSGTASALDDIPGDPVYGKTGTAEYGTDVPPRSHSWFAGFQGDLAVAVLVEDGGFGAEAAVPVADRFFTEMNS